MQTVYDWVTLTIFTGLVVLFLDRSAKARNGQEPNDSLLAYLAAGVMCAVANYIGNNGENVLAILVIAANLVFIALVLKPINLRPMR